MFEIAKGMVMNNQDTSEQCIRNDDRLLAVSDGDKNSP